MGCGETVGATEMQVSQMLSPCPSSSPGMSGRGKRGGGVGGVARGRGGRA
jgi:hypothetical protein